MEAGLYRCTSGVIKLLAFEARFLQLGNVRPSASGFSPNLSWSQRATEPHVPLRARAADIRSQVTPVVDLGVSVYRAQPVSAAAASAAAASGLLFRSLGADADAAGADLADICSDPTSADTALCDEVWARTAAGGMDDGVAGDYGGAMTEAEEAGDNTCLIRMLGCRLEGSAAVRAQQRNALPAPVSCLDQSWVVFPIRDRVPLETHDNRTFGCPIPRSSR